MSRKERADVLCVSQGLFDSREKAKRAIMAGIVHTKSERIDKPGMKIPADTELFIKGEKLKYVSRGGLKLEKALQTFPIEMQDKVMMDIGSSTGGFTDCALQNGARKVIAVDVGTNQLVWSLRSDERVEVHEQTNFRHVTPDMFSEAPDVATIDVSFISLAHIFAALKDIIKPGGVVMALIKPQFEAGREQVGKHGIVREASVHEDVVNRVKAFAQDNGFGLLDLTYSPITGGEGNIEFLGYFKQGAEPNDVDVHAVVTEAHGHFEGK